MAATASFLTPCITPLVLFRDQIRLGVATGFFLKVDGAWNLVTNWHVFSGCRPDTGQPRHSNGAVPNKCIFFRSGLSDEKITWAPETLDLGDALTDTANWFQHPARGQSVDVASFPISGEQVGKSKDLLEADAHDPDMFVDVGGEVFLPGYPQGLTGGGRFPLWKRASLATSLEWGVGIEDRFFVDTASREGMSGSPCLAISNWQHYRMDRDTLKVSVIRSPMSWRLLGIYSGRLNAQDDFGAQVGIVWRDTLIFDVIRGGVHGSVKIAKSGG
ncbi:hypothetical protein [Pseudooceanicola sp. 200-1SW]|uniref:hypothetical protein n=1 Tax=Pseudooceanicola sp. 200-1SW TaxID=3425949 RepID=UPI003D7F8022